MTEYRFELYKNNKLVGYEKHHVIYDGTIVILHSEDQKNWKDYKKSEIECDKKILVSDLKCSVCNNVISDKYVCAGCYILK